MNAFEAPSPMGGQGMPQQAAGGPQGGPGGPGNAFMGGGPAMGPGGPAGAPAAPAKPPTAEQIAQARAHITPVVDGLMHLLAKPPGKLDKKAVFDAASTMISRGAFPTPESKQDLIGTLAKMPDDDLQLRKVLGELLVQTAANRAKFHAVHGAD